ncbi:MAG: methyltransferase domain-containing protein [Terriglobia bacterium]
MPTVRRTIQKAVNTILIPAGYELLPRFKRDYVRSYQPLRETLKEARKAGLSIGDYLDKKYQLPGVTQSTIDQLASYGILNSEIKRVCEIGPGTGRYLERIQRLCSPSSYEVYETDPQWDDYVVRMFHVTSRETDGLSLRQTDNDSVDLVHAHRVFPYLPFIVQCRYFLEMIRITKPGGWIVFDTFTEPCMTEELLQKWIGDQRTDPCMVPRKFMEDLFARRQCSLRWSFFIHFRPGITEYLVFTKNRI